MKHQNPKVVAEFNRLLRLARSRKAVGKALTPSEGERLHKLAWDINKADPETGSVGDIDPEAVLAGIKRPDIGLGVEISQPEADRGAFLADYQAAIVEERKAEEAATKIVAEALTAAISAAAAAAL
jgi:hypothetical protein